MKRKNRRPVLPALSPRIQPEIHAGGTLGRNGANSTASPVSDAGDTRKVRRPKLNTNTSVRRGGQSTFPAPKPEDLVGGQIVRNGDVPEFGGKQITAPWLTRTNYGRKIDPVDLAVTGHNPAHIRAAKRNARMLAGAESDAEGIRQKAMTDRSMRIGYGIPDNVDPTAWMKGK